MAQKKPLLTKSSFLYGMQCDKLLWIDRNRPELLPEVNENTQAIFDQGHEVGHLAKELYPGGIEINWSEGHDAGIARTRADVLVEFFPDARTTCAESSRFENEARYATGRSSNLSPLSRPFLSDRMESGSCPCDCCTCLPSQDNNQGVT